MSVEITIKGPKNTPEYRDAERLKRVFEQQIYNKLDGRILIVANATLFGQATKDVDIIVFGTVDRFYLDLNCRTHEDNSEIKPRRVFINNFCFCIESKSHSPRDVVLDGQTLCVRYNDKLHDVTTQSERQKYALKSFLDERTGKAPFICNFVWLTNVDADALKALTSASQTTLPHNNYLPSNLNLKWLFQLACVQRPPYHPAGREYCTFRSMNRDVEIADEEFTRALELFTEQKQAIGDMSRKKLEIITRRLLDFEDQKYAAAIGKQLVVISGRAGTGKTIKLLRIACDLARNHGKRCLILTYNLALVSDIKRTLALSGIPDGIDTYTVSIQSLYKFFFELLLGFGITLNGQSGDEQLRDRKGLADFISHYREYLKALVEYIDEGLIQQSDIQALMLSRHDEVAWDYLLVDEAQDWDDEERKVLFKIFGADKIIIADGRDQLVRSHRPCNWTKGIQAFQKRPEQRSLRQTRNLVQFVNSYAQTFGLNWRLEPSDDLTGGKVIVIAQPIEYEAFRAERDRCVSSGNKAYEMMFLVPPSYVDRTGDDSRFKLTADFLEAGFPTWDGTSKDLRTTYPTDLDQHRILQYDSCRGLEAWVTICIALDDFVRYKAATFDEEEQRHANTSAEAELFQASSDELRHAFVHLWSLIPLTRAIDTLVITLRNPQSEYSQKLKQCCLANRDFVEWRE
jgi:hypothetical protein